MIRVLGGLQNIVDKKQWVRVADAMKIPKAVRALSVISFVTFRKNTKKRRTLVILLLCMVGKIPNSDEQGKEYLAINSRNKFRTKIKETLIFVVSDLSQLTRALTLFMLPQKRNPKWQNQNL